MKKATSFFWLSCLIATFLYLTESVNGVNSTVGGETKADSLQKSTDQEVSKATVNPYMMKIFHKYGDNNVLTFEGFEHLLQHLGLGKILITDHRLADHYKGNEFSELHKDHNHSMTAVTGNIVDEGKPQYPQELVEHDDQDHDEDLDDESSEFNAAGSEIEAAEQSADSRPKRTAERDTKLPLFNQLNKRKKCLSAKELLATHEIHSVNNEINEDNFLYVCPAIISQLDDHACRRRMLSNYRRKSSTSTTPPLNDNTLLPNATAELTGAFWDVSWKAWLFAVISVSVISLVGLLCVAIVPLLQLVFFEQILQFLMAVAVGTLTGDALLHLLPHAFAHAAHHDEDHEKNHDEESSDESEAIFKGMMALAGIYIFFIMEHVIKLLSRTTLNKRDKSSVQLTSDSANAAEVTERRQIGVTLTHREISSASISSKMSRLAGKPSSQDFLSLSTLNEDQCMVKEPEEDRPLMMCDERIISLELRDEVALSTTTTGPHSPRPRPIVISSSKASLSDGGLLFIGSNKTTVTTTQQGQVCNGRGDIILQEKPLHHDHNDTRQSHNVVAIFNNGDKYVPAKNIDSDKHGNTEDKGSHGHGHAVPTSIASMAWMVIMGDGLHNFTDGLAIGAAFATGLSGGLSTSVAVFCHELPHELGDFAVLLKCGMSVRQALSYNLISSILSFLGMFVGIFIGNVGSANQWIFALTAGIFIYISLVDMLPQMIPVKLESTRMLWRQLFLQFVGLSLGVVVMLVIALHEEKIRFNVGDNVV